MCSKKKLISLSVTLVLSLMASIWLFAGEKSTPRSVQEIAVDISTVSAKLREDPSLLADFKRLFEEASAIYRQDPSSDNAFEAMLLALNNPGNLSDIYTVLARHHLNNPDLHLFINESPVWMLFTASAEQLFRSAIDQSPHPDVRTVAKMALAKGYMLTADHLADLNASGVNMDEYLASALETVDPSLVDVHVSVYNNSYAAVSYKNDQLPDIATLKERAKQLLEETSKEAGDIDLYRYSFTEQGRVTTPVGKLIDRVTALQNLQVMSPGSKIPEVAGIVDYQGEAAPSFKDYRGKVLLLDFWATWCGPCMDAMPHHRELVKHLKDRPFELISLSVDGDIEDAIAYRDEDGMPFVNWYIGPEHKMLKEWGVNAFPTVFVVDHKGVIRSKSTLGHEQLAKYIETLVEEAEEG